VKCTGFGCIKLRLLLLIDVRGCNWRQSAITKFANTTMIQMIDENVSVPCTGTVVFLMLSEDE
jgi:hypothetical protein